MNILSHLRKSSPYSQMLWGMLLLLIVCFPAQVMAQITIGGNVYGGGDMGNVGGNTRVHMLSGVLGTDDPDNPGGSVFGGARMADIAGNTLVHIDGAYTDNEDNVIAATDYMVINRVYGGNDISGHIGTDKEAAGARVPTDVISSDEVDDTWDAFVHISNQKADNAEPDPDPTRNEDTKKIYIGQLFGGGNGEYQYTSTTDQQTNVTTHIILDHNGNTVATTTNDFNYPDIGKTLVDIHGGSIVYAYGGGNMATVTDQTIICVDNPSKVVNMIKVDANGLQKDNGTNILSDNRFKAMGINTGYSKPGSDEYQIGRLFGGNNLAEMAIRPTWHLQTGKIRNLYSGGNKGAMTNLQGLLLDIDPDDNDKDKLFIDYVYGGGRMADVRPLSSGTIAGEDAVDAEPYQIQLGNDVTDKNGVGYNFPGGLSSRVLVKGGHINNVYGGNDVTGHVYGGSAVGIYTTIYGDVYGGGNGSYPYTDNPVMENDDVYGDFYYGDYYNKAVGGKSSVQALNDFRPDAEQISLYLKGTENNPTIVKGSVYLGGNSATMRTTKDDPMVELKLGSYVIADNVFMGNNGENMVTVNEGTATQLEGVLRVMSRKVDDTDNTSTPYYSSLSDTLSDNENIQKDESVFKTYMEGAAMSLNPSSSKRIVFDDGYVPYSAQIGSLYCGGNVGSMTYSGTQIMDFSAPIIIYNKLVGGCNNADVPYRADYNAAYEGGILGTTAEQASYTDNSGNIKDRLVLNFEGLRIVPKRWNEAGTELVYNTVKWDENEGDFVQIGTNNPDDDADRRLYGGNIYGGCYNSGHVNGNVVININDDIIDRYGPNGLFADTKMQVKTENGNPVLDNENNPIEEEVIDYSGGKNPRSYVILNEQAWDVMSLAMTVFGAGKGELTEVWGSTTVNLNKGYAFQVFGGGEHGYVGKGVIKTTGDIYDAQGYYSKDYSKYDIRSGGLADNNAEKMAYSSTVNLNSAVAVYDETSNPEGKLAETEYIYGAGNEGDVCGNSYVYLGNGRIFDAFGGASDADIYGHTEVYIGRRNKDDNGIDEPPFPYIRDIVYGGNDFGGSILGKGDMSGRVRDNATLAMVHPTNNDGDNIKDVLQTATYVEYLQGRVDTIFGGSYGFYDYNDTKTYGYADDVNHTIRTAPYQHSSFVNIRPNNNNNNNNINTIFGGGAGWPGDRRGDAAQDRSYVLIDIPGTPVEEFGQFRYTQVFGAGSYNGLGMRYTYNETTAQGFDLDNNVSAIVDLVSGQVGAAYGGSYNQGVTRRTVVNVPEGSTVNVGSIFGGAYGTDEILPCDVYEANVNYNSPTAVVYSNTGLNEMFRGAIYGGNNSYRRTVFGKVNVNSKLTSYSAVYGNTKGTVYGAGYGPSTWSEYTEVNILPNADVWEVYGGGENGLVLNSETVGDYMRNHAADQELLHKPENLTYEQENAWNTKWQQMWRDAWIMGNGYNISFDDNEHNVDYLYRNSPIYNLNNPLARTAEVDERTTDAQAPAKITANKYNTNVIIKGNVQRYAYGGGLGANATVAGSTYIALLGGTVGNDLYAAGTSGDIQDLFGIKNFKASATAYIEGGIVRNVYGGGWRGSVGHANFKKDAPVVYQDEYETVYEQIPDFTVTDNQGNKIYTDILGESHVVVGLADNSVAHTFAKGKPSITRNVYGGGEGGAVFGTTYVSIYDGYIGYRAKNTGTAQNPVYVYAEENDDATEGDNKLASHGGNVFGGGYVANSSVDETCIKMYGGVIRGDLFGGGEIATVGRGTVKPDNQNYNYSGIHRLLTGNNQEAKIYKAGQTHVYVYGGHIKKNVFGGGRGYDNWEGDGTYKKDESYVAQMDLKSKGYVFGTTDVNIYGGEIGTVEGVEAGLGNVFGGGDQGLVYSAYMQDGKLFIGKKNGERYDKNDEGYYYKFNGTNYVGNDGVALEGANPTKQMTQDCNVLVEPHALVEQDVTIGTTDYTAGQYVPTSELNKLKGKTDETDAAKWKKLNSDGIIIHNAVFAGGNLKEGSNSEFVDAVTVFGNATASINDAYNRDLITIGTGHTGGLYGDGNLTFVDGYRGLNITNYGTDYYHIASSINIIEYRDLPAREQDYYELTFKVKEGKTVTDNDGTTYTAGATLPQDEIVTLFAGSATSEQYLTSDGKAPNPEYWEENGVVSIYAGRIMNTIQRADFCGVFGSRMVMRGARDRVSTEANFTNYTINRVREVSLNKVETKAGDTDPKNVLHGNYFGIYSVVNYLGALTSDIDFYSTRTTDANLEQNPELEADGTTTFAQWKEAKIKERSRNNGNCYNHLALASGVYLELTTEESTGDDLNEKVWGLVTGVIELDLINVQTGVGGGFIYAKNEHGKRKSKLSVTPLLPALNATAITNRQWEYETADDENHKDEWETSGNFIHSSQTIIDDCYSISGKYMGSDAVPAHYWYIHGQIYIYDQYISAYTGSPNAYSETVDIPLTITAASNGELTLMNVKPNRYAYYAPNSNGQRLESNKKMVINNVTYNLNDPISWWDWHLLPAAERELFVEETYTTIMECQVGTGENARTIPAGYVMLPTEYNQLQTLAVAKDMTDDNVNNPEKTVVVNGNKDELFSFVFRPSNNIGHSTGYILTYNVNNPTLWNKWYTEQTDPSTGRNTVNTTTFETYDLQRQSEFHDAPTYRLKDGITAGLFGQLSYEISDLISDNVYQTYQTAKSQPGITLSNNQATFYPAYITTRYVETYKIDPKNSSNSIEQHLQPKVALAQQEYTTENWNTLQSSVAEAYICTKSLKISDDEVVLINTLMTLAEKNSLISGINTRITSAATNMSAQDVEALDLRNLSDGQKEALGPLGLSLLSLREDVKNNIQKAYYCTASGLYGGNYYEQGQNYRALEAWSSMSEADRQNFTFNYDALDLLIDPAYGVYYQDQNRREQKEGKKYQYDGKPYTFNPATATQAELDELIYSLTRPIDYQATYGGSTTSSTAADVDYTDINGQHTVKAMKYNNGTEDKYVKVGEELDREAYEMLPNEKRYYSPITVEVKATTGENPTYSVTTPNVYVVNTPFVHGETPYAVGTVISSEIYTNRLTDEEKRDNITTLTFRVDDMDKTNNNVPVTTTFYYCREGYEIGEKGEGQPVTTVNGIGGEQGSWTGGQNVPLGAVIRESTYKTLTNRQLNFAIHGVSPKETSTLYVSRNSDLYDLSKEKIITVVYQYDYQESDASGLHITPVSESHIVNIHIQFKSGIPFVENIEVPDMVNPGVSILMETPNVTPGAYTILSSGWEIFEKEDDAESHVNGIEYVPSSDPLYWYQDGYYLAYYAKTYLGKTYSNIVPISVANYHDLKKVMDDKQHHLYVDYDRTRIKRNSKIYIDNYSGAKDGAELLKDFIDLSYLNATSTGVTDGVVTAQGDLNGHSLLNNTTDYLVIDGKPIRRGVKGGTNLEFILNANVNHPANEPWTPIANNENECFNGTLHGDGYTISGLDNSLIGMLCGDVYNLGVTGSFSGAGIAERGEGYIENSWISTTSTAAKTALPILGNPGRDSEDSRGPIQVVNSYYLENYDDAYQVNGNNATPKEGSYTKLIADREASANYVDNGTPIRKDAQAFYNGEVAYDLNGFYLNKRYYDGTNLSSGDAYYYIDPTMAYNPDQEKPKQLKTGYYPARPASSATADAYAKYGDRGYVEERYADGDFRYASGIIPTWTDDHERVVKVSNGNGGTTNKTIFAPIWPKDYIFFGQDLTFGYVDDRAHQEMPSHHSSNNRVYRAPAYYGDSKMDVAYFNPNAVLVSKEKLTDEQVAANATAHDAFPGMTAIDFTGYNNGTTYSQGQSEATASTPSVFYAPMLDFGGLTGFRNDGQTKNMLVYADYEDDGKADVETTVEKTLSVLNNYLVEPEYRRHANNVVSNGQGGENTTPIDDYGSVKQVSNIAVNNVHGHLVLKKANDYVAATDHFLVDKNELNEPFDFNAPIEYTMGKRDNNEPNIMWYQRTPDVFVQNAGTGWESISLPFTATTVTTNQKGVITHFYQGNNNDKGHEYWLRTPDRIDETNNIIKVLFKSPASGTGSVDNTTFLWDYYYSKNHQETGKPGRDANDDTYQDDYYKTQTPFSNYPYATAAEPYLIGFPSERYYEFDLSGNFVAQNTAVTAPAKLDKQTVTFVSATDGTVRINVSDQDYENMTSIAGNSGTFNFKPIYQARQLDTESTYLLNDQAITVTGAQSGNVTYNAGTAFLKDGVAGSATVPFRAYISSNNTAGRVQTRGANLTNALYIGYAGNNDQLEDRASLGGLIIYSQDMNICVESTLDYETQVTIYTVAGKLLKRFNIKPATKVTVPVNNRGVYIVNRKKIAVTR